MGTETLADINATWERELRTCERPWREHTIAALRSDGGQYSDFIGWEAWMSEQDDGQVLDAVDDIYDRIAMYDLMCKCCAFGRTSAATEATRG